MEKVFLGMLQMSLSASVVILAVACIRLLLKRMPRWISYLLWIVVFIRLVCPFSIEAPFGVVPGFNLLKLYQESPKQQMQAREGWKEQANGSGARFLPQTEEQIGNMAQLAEGIKAEGNENRLSAAFETAIVVSCIVWQAVALGLGLYFVLSYFKFFAGIRKLEAEGAVKTVYQGKQRIITDGQLNSPFTAGLFHPVIYLPAGLESRSRELIIAHERIHIRRRDYLVKPMALLVLCVYWFNPLVWLAAWMMERDMEASCDEAVLRGADSKERSLYAETLLCLAQRPRVSGYPIAFGEKGVKMRIKNTMKLKKRKPWLIAVCAAAVGVIALFLLINGKNNILSPADTRSAASEAGTEKIETMLTPPESAEDKGEEEFLPSEKISVRTEPSDAEEAEEHFYEPSPRESGYNEPVDNARVSNDFGTRTHPVTGKEETHNGIDFAAEEGTPVKAAAKGTIYEAGENDEWGNYVIIQHAGGEMSYYMCCRDIFVKSGDEVEEGEEIATVGNSGKSTGAHLHFAVSRDGSYIEPVFK